MGGIEMVGKEGCMIKVGEGVLRARNVQIVDCEILICIAPE